MSALPTTLPTASGDTSGDATLVILICGGVAKMVHRAWLIDGGRAAESALSRQILGTTEGLRGSNTIVVEERAFDRLCVWLEHGDERMQEELTKENAGELLEAAGYFCLDRLQDAIHVELSRRQTMKEALERDVKIRRELQETLESDVKIWRQLSGSQCCLAQVKAAQVKAAQIKAAQVTVNVGPPLTTAGAFSLGPSLGSWIVRLRTRSPTA